MRLHLKNLFQPFYSAFLGVVILLLGSMFTSSSVCFGVEPAVEVNAATIHKAIQKMEDIIAAHLANRHIPGCAVGIVYRNEIIYLKGFGHCTLNSDQKITPETVFQLGSVSKPIAATLAVILENQGLLDIDASVTDYVPNFSLHSKQPSATFTVKNILTHTSGVPKGGFNNMIEHYASHQELVKALAQKRVTARVGHRYEYHNAMYAVISDVIQGATHKKFETALSQYLLTPLSMTCTSTTLAGLLSCPNRAVPHTRGAKGLCACADYSRGYYAVVPAGGINSCAKDMAIFLKAMMGGYPNVVTSKAIDRMLTPYIPTNNLLGSVPGAALRLKHPHYGLGWRLVSYVDQPLVYHGGWLRGFTNFIGFLPREKLGIVILHNGDTKFSAKTGMKFFETALGLAELPEGGPCKRPCKKSNKKSTAKQNTAKKKSSKITVHKTTIKKTSKQKPKKKG